MMVVLHGNIVQLVWFSEAKPVENRVAEGLDVKEMVMEIQGCSLHTDLQDVGYQA